MLRNFKHGWLSRFACDRRGVSAVEFAFIAPVMIGLYLGCAEISDGVAADRKVSLIADTLANLGAQVTSISNAQMTNILDASSAIIAPYSASNLQMKLSCIKIDSTGVAKVQWGASRNTTARAHNDVYTFPSGSSALAVPGSWLLLAEVSYAYTPTIGYTISGSLTLSDKMYMAPRISAPSYGDAPAVGCT
ncbi:MAG TPA: TadE/TadG family type IV pilus assembly protein [Pseudolabrys sp.]|nr:TadE/TadG family type IV pilus assembly protein [Pseudolabrys sp.]